MADDCAIAGHAPLPDRAPAFPPAPHLPSHPSFGYARCRGRRRCQSVRSAGHLARGHHRNGQYRRCGHGSGIGRPWRRPLVLDYRRTRHCHEVFRGASRRQIPRPHQRWHHARRTYVRPRARPRMEEHGYCLLRPHGHRLFWYRQHRPEQCHLYALQRDLRHSRGRHRSSHRPPRRARHPVRSQGYSTFLHDLCSPYGLALRRRLHRHPVHQCLLCLGCALPHLP